QLKKGGTLILSTPFGKGRGIPSGNRFHVHQRPVVEFKELFSDYSDVEFYGQKGALIVPENFAPKKYVPLGIAVCRKYKIKVIDERSSPITHRNISMTRTCHHHSIIYGRRGHSLAYILF